MDEVKVLQRKLHDTLDGAAKLPLLLSLSEKLLSAHIENALSYAEEAHALALKLNDQCGQAEAKRLIGLVFYFKATYGESLKCLNEALEMYTACNNAMGQANTYNSIGILYIAITELDKAIAVFEKTMALYTESGTEQDIAKALCNLSIPYKTMGEYERALDLLNQAIAIHEKNGDWDSINNANANKAGVYFHLDRYQEALEMFMTCKDYYLKEHNRPYYANTLMSVAGCYSMLLDYPSCLKYLQLSLKEFTSLGMRRSMAGIYNDMGATLARMGGYEEAEKYAERSIKMLEEDNNLGEMYSVACHSLGAAALQNKKTQKGRNVSAEGTEGGHRKECGTCNS